MTDIAEFDDPAGGNAVRATWTRLLTDIAVQLRELGAHPARTVVLLPYAQLMPLATRLWAEQFASGFVPRFETTRNWASRVGTFQPGPSDLSFDRGRDLLAAGSLLDGAGLGAQRGLLAGPLVELASQLGQMAASVPAAMRPDWADHARQALPPMGDGPLALEAALGRIAVAWAANSDYATDVLFTQRVANELDALFIVEGLQADPLTTSLAQHYFEQTVVLQPQIGAANGTVALHTCADGEDEAERAAACVLQHLAAGRVPVALSAGDRVLTRRITALLAARGVPLRDETGWKLSTTHAAAQLHALLQACAPMASTDAVLDALKLAPAFDAGAVRRLEQALRRQPVRSWMEASVTASSSQDLVAQVEAWRAPMDGRQTLGHWLTQVRSLLQAAGVWPALAGDSAGAALIDALGLGDAALNAWQQWPAAQRRVGLAEFTRWASDTLEAASFRPPVVPNAPVVVLPMSQLLGRPFAALVVPGADERRLPAMPEPPGPWSAAQRVALHLPSREQLRDAQAAAWRLVLRVPQVDILWRTSDDSGEHLSPSPLVQALQMGLTAATPPQPGTDPRPTRTLTATPQLRPAPSGAALPPKPLSASSYEMLRACPYRFFALHQLGLRAEGELDVDIDKRDWGNWVHAVLRHFHEALQADPAADRLTLMEAAAAQAMRDLGLGLDEGEFMPFSVAWPGLRDAYLQWFSDYQRTGMAFESAETALRAEPAGLALFGRLDRVDRQPDGAPMLIDYKTERAERSKDRVAAGNEDTQLPFYALLSGAAAPRAAYLNLAEREAPKLYELKNLPALAHQLLGGMRDDMARIAAGAPLPALGEGSVCDWCDARGLCRKDMW
ncbi:PD-(D/E)XK nuclease family protein [Ottowia sp. GY511]|uniref:PD-(D/E)XK nuclease family protein n=1 Tax=Ottowia flava TaxID=2675430 RepID=A0ABW4KV14_9BURK|nr:PD-(D/E)XK nuclease family protein [Ottowia sp. GY511]TXK31498.1 PD-(D/E)XK nuclease family protein [Ottowia sp. GY511]